MSAQLIPSRIGFGSKALSLIPKNNNTKVLIIKTNAEYNHKILETLTKYFTNIEIFNANKNINKNEGTNINKLSVYKPNVVIVIGGGTTVDFAKRIKIELEKILNYRLYFVIIPSRLGSGTESSMTSITRQKKKKIISVNEGHLPNLVLYFYDLFKTISNIEHLMGYIDAITHCIESKTSFNSNIYSDFISSATIELSKNETLISKLIGKGQLEKSEYQLLSLISFNSGVAQNNAGSGICHALAHAAEEMTHYSHIECISYFLPYVIRYLSLFDETKNLVDKQNKIFYDKIVQHVRSEVDLSEIDIILKNNTECEKLLSVAKNDPCWRLYKNKIHVDMLLEQLKSDEYSE